MFAHRLLSHVVQQFDVVHLFVPREEQRHTLTQVFIEICAGQDDVRMRVVHPRRLPVFTLAVVQYVAVLNPTLDAARFKEAI